MAQGPSLPDTLDIFCDESGFTGQHLLNPDQRYFAYGSVGIAREEASALVAKTIRDFRLQGHELKGKNLLKHASGRKAATALIKELGDRQIDFGFNLAGPIALAKSHDCPGIQLADVVAAVAVAAFAEPSEKWSRDVLRSMFASGSIHPDGIVPEHDRLDLHLPGTRLNVLILLELLRRSEEGVSLTNGLPDFIHRTAQLVSHDGSPAD